MALENFDPPRLGGRVQSGKDRTARRVNKRSSVIFEHLRREIMLGMLAPRSMVLELELADRFNCSQSTVREALLSLQEEGLVHRRAHRGTQVADCRVDDAKELIHLRHEIECRGVVRGLRRYDKQVRDRLYAEIEAMRAAAGDGDEYRLSVHDRQFHIDLYEIAELPGVQPMLERCLTHNHRYKILNSGPDRGLLETADRHLAIVEALDSGHVMAAEAALSHHITTIVEFGSSLIARDPFDSGPAGPAAGGGDT